MADYEHSPSLARTQARTQAQRRRRRRSQRRVVGAVAIALVGILAALVLTDSIHLPSSDGPTRASGVAAVSPPTAATRKPTKEPEVECRTLTSDDPLRLWIAGDSLAGSLGPSLGLLTAETGVVQPQYDSRVSSGLLNTSFFNWPRHATEEIADLDPEAIVYVIGTNDAVVYTEAQAAKYAQLTEDMMRLLVGTGRHVYWVNPPVMKDEDFEADAQRVGAIQQEVSRKFKRVTYVDAHALFSDPDGEYTSYIVDPATQKRVTMRAGDGVHFSPAGADYLADAVFPLLDHDWCISRQADPTQPKRVIESRGSTQVAGTSRSSSSSGSSSGSSGGSSVSTTTSTAPAPTTTTTPVAPPPSTTPTTTATTTAASSPSP